MELFKFLKSLLKKKLVLSFTGMQYDEEGYPIEDTHWDSEDDEEDEYEDYNDYGDDDETEWE